MSKTACGLFLCRLSSGKYNKPTWWGLTILFKINKSTSDISNVFCYLLATKPFGMIRILLGLLVVVLLSCSRREDVRQYAPIETYPNDSLLATISDKRALIVVAHDDDMCAIAGTAAKLHAAGWYLGVVSLTKTPERNAAQRAATRHFLDTVMFIDLQPDQYRRDTASNPYKSFPRDQFASVFNIPLLDSAYYAIIHAFQPSVIFSLDDVMGGYGHPEHIMVSSLVAEMFAAGRLSARYIYQSVFTDHMENTIMARHAKRLESWGLPHDDWEKAKALYSSQAMPEPTVQINIKDQAETKMRYLRSYNKRERQILGFFIPEFEKYDATTYFSWFDREFFRVLGEGDL